jgi:pimeloyl-ACP methyl ester carboxylesterase
MRLHPPGAPVAFIAGTRSREVRQAGLAATQRITRGRISWIEGTHLFPFEKPQETVQEVLDWMERLEAVASRHDD